MTITLEKLQSFFEDTPQATLQKYINPLNDTLNKYEINTPARIAMFFAQIGEESGGLTVTEENMNYSAERLLQVFPRYFKSTDPNQYAHNPEKLANYVYANRMGNGDPESGDGFKYKGAGFIQITGYDNFSDFANDENITIDYAVEYLKTPEGACESAGWYWKKYNLNQYSDAGNVLKVTQIINGGTIGLDRRQQLYNEALSVFS